MNTFDDVRNDLDQKKTELDEIVTKLQAEYANDDDIYFTLEELYDKLNRFTSSVYSYKRFFEPELPEQELLW